MLFIIINITLPCQLFFLSRAENRFVLDKKSGELLDRGCGRGKSIPSRKETPMHRQRVIASCPTCGDGVPARCPAPCHGIHLLPSLVTKGLWVVVWMLVTIRSSRCRCCLCGHPLWITAGHPDTARPTLAAPWINHRAWHCQQSPQNRFRAYLVENGLVYYTPTRL